MVFSKVFAPLFAVMLATSASASPAASPEANASINAINAASYYNPAGGFGACGSVLRDSDFIVALGTDHWDGGSHCGQTMTVQRRLFSSISHNGESFPFSGNGASISVNVADLCPGCVGLHGANSIDLSQDAMAALDSNFVNDGITTVQWTLP
ncbi:RlpA-like double-psi beta-barrel-protein domain-containing protein-containing protein [Mycena capillaripes]|nr:RlpA-like double-psi beta-barrel-protein domain-containing protein-containing protein [Mycena capillaripes]